MLLMDVVQIGDRRKKRVFPYAAIIASITAAFVDCASVAQPTTGNSSEQLPLPQAYYDFIPHLCNAKFLRFCLIK